MCLEDDVLICIQFLQFETYDVCLENDDALNIYIFTHHICLVSDQIFASLDG